jgi:C-terminal processing protease CtpA/Prc
VDNDGAQDSGVQVFAIAYWSNIWGDPFLEARDGTGWSTAYASTITDPEQDDEIRGGLLIVWAPDDQQGFPNGFGKDGLLFTEDDPIETIPTGYTIVDLNQEPFNFYKQSHVEIELNEGAGAVNDFSEMDYAQAFQALWQEMAQKYPFTAEKDLDWGALLDEFKPLAEASQTDEAFYQVIKDFTQQIPDGHVNVSFNSQVFFEQYGGGFGLVLTELSDGRVIVTEVLEDTPASLAGIVAGDEIIAWDGVSTEAAINAVVPFFGPYSTDHTRRVEQVNFLTRVPPDSRLEVIFKKEGEAQGTETTMQAFIEYDSLFKTIPSLNRDEFYLPVEGSVLDDSGLGYLRIATFSDDYSLMARLWEHFMENLIDDEIPALIIDLRANGGGSSRMAQHFAGYFFNEEIPLYQRLYYNSASEEFESSDEPIIIEPAPLYYDGPIAVLVSPNCVSACEGFVYSLVQNQRSLIIGHYPTAGAFGEVGRGQYDLPGEISMQFPTGRPERLDGQLLIEGSGVIPDISVPITEESALGVRDTVLEAAIQALLDLLQ